MTTIRSGESSALSRFKGFWSSFKPGKPEAKPTSGDTSSVDGLDRLRKAARTGMLQAPPWEDTGPTLASLKKQYGDKLDPKTFERLAKFDREGKLTADENGRSIASVIDKQLKAGAKPEIIDALVRQLTNPTAHIKQADEMSCVATDGQLQMAMFTPARYLDFMANLMDDGKANLKGFGEFSIGKDRLKYNMDNAKGWNAKINEIAQEAFMGLAKGSGVTGTSFSQGMQFLQTLTGIPVFSPDKLREAVEAGKANGVSRNQVTQDLLRAGLANAFAAGQPGLSVALSHGKTDEAHMVMITGMDPQGHVTFHDGINPPQTMSLFDFAKHVTMFSNKDLGAGRALKVVPPTSGELG